MTPERKPTIVLAGDLTAGDDWPDPTGARLGDGLGLELQAIQLEVGLTKFCLSNGKVLVKGEEPGPLRTIRLDEPTLMPIYHRPVRNAA